MKNKIKVSQVSLSLQRIATKSDLQRVSCGLKARFFKTTHTTHTTFYNFSHTPTGRKQKQPSCWDEIDVVNVVKVVWVVLNLTMPMVLGCQESGQSIC